MNVQKTLGTFVGIGSLLSGNEQACFANSFADPTRPRFIGVGTLSRIACRSAFKYLEFGPGHQSLK